MIDGCCLAYFGMRLTRQASKLLIDVHQKAGVLRRHLIAFEVVTKAFAASTKRES